MRLSFLYFFQSFLFEVKALDLIGNRFKIEDYIIVPLIILIIANIISNDAAIDILHAIELDACIFEQFLNIFDKIPNILRTDLLGIQSIVFMYDDG